MKTTKHTKRGVKDPISEMTYEEMFNLLTEFKKVAQFIRNEQALERYEREDKLAVLTCETCKDYAKHFNFYPHSRKFPPRQDVAGTIE
jgi:hypothetical protein